MIKKICSLCIIALIIITLFLGCGQSKNNSSPPQKAQAFKVGVILPLTGPAATYGQNAKQGIELAVEEINQRTGINNRSIELIIEDSQGEIKQGVSVLNKILSTYQPSVILGAGASSVTLSLAPIVEKNKIILFSSLSSAPTISQAGDYIFRNWQSDDLEAKVMAVFVAEELGYDKLSILHLNNDLGIQLEKTLSHNFKTQGGQILTSQKFEQDQIDFRSYLTKIKQAHPQALYLVSYPKETAMIIKQISELDMNIQILGLAMMEAEELIERLGILADNILYTYSAPLDNYSVAQNFRVKYKQKYNQQPGLGCDTSYDAVYLIKKAIELTGCMTSDCIKNGLYRIRNFPGAAGSTTFDENGDVEREIIIKTIKDGQFVEYLSN